jgi:NAD(P)H dehydrogenase (quinone)|tara:strand:- start:103 stop:1011 length:909 start_codon:yes stop_codon:yes gene_type:complete
VNKILVYGATGDQGLPLIDELLKNGYKVRAASRNPDDFNAYNPSDVEAVKADLFDIESLRNVSKDIDGIAMNLPFVFDKEIAKTWGENITKAGSDEGVKKIVFNTSCYVAPNDNGLAAHDGRRAIEKAMEESGMEYVVIRSMVFMDNLTRFWSKPSITNNNIFAYPCSSELKISWVCLEDVAKFMVASLSSSSMKADKIYVGGPEILLGKDVAEKFSKVLGREIIFKSLEPQNFAGAMSKLVTGSEIYEDQSIYGGMAAFYSWYNQQNPSPLAVDMNLLYKSLNVNPTYFEDWIKKHNWDKV